MQSRTGRLHVLRLAGTALESVARPLVERELHRLRAERSKGPPDDGFRPTPGPKSGEDPPPTQPPPQPPTQPPDDGFRPSPGDPAPEPPTQPPDDGFRPKPGEDPPPGGDDDPPPGDGDDEEPDPCTAEAEAVDAAQEKVDSLQAELDTLLERERQITKETAQLRKQISALREAIAEDARRQELRDIDIPAAPKFDKRLRRLSPSVTDLLPPALRFLFDSKPLNADNDRKLLEFYELELAKNEDELSMLNYAIEDTRRRLGAAKGAVRRAQERLAACRAGAHSS